MSLYGDFILPATLASPTEYATFLGVDPATNPANITRILAECTRIVLSATTGAIYDVDPATGLSTNTQRKNALRDMTCAQAAAWVKLNIDPDLGGIATATGKTSKKIGTAAVTYADSDVASTAAQRAAAMDALVPSAARIGQLNDLLGNEPFAL